MLPQLYQGVSQLKTIVYNGEEPPLKIIPVIDIQNGIAVHAVRGIRKAYKPLESVLSGTANPLDVAVAFKEFGFSELYVADLDAISGGRPDNSLIKQIADATSLKLMVDAGVADLGSVEELIRNHASKVIIGTETLPSLSFVDQAIRAFGGERVIASLDMKNGKLLATFNLAGTGSPLDLLRKFQSMGLTQAIILDLSRVGSNEGTDTTFLREILRRVRLDIYAGGGVRTVADLTELRDIGISGVLVATALHSGRITREQLQKTGLL